MYRRLKAEYRGTSIQKILCASIFDMKPFISSKCSRNNKDYNMLPVYTNESVDFCCYKYKLVNATRVIARKQSHKHKINRP